VRVEKVPRGAFTRNVAGMSSLPAVAGDPSMAPEQDWRDASDVGVEESRDAWAVAARPVLVDVAQHYHAVITHKELVAEVQERSGIRTTQLGHYWIADVLGRVSSDAVGRGEPILAALCVNPQGSVGEGYVATVGRTTDDLTGDADDHAALQRLACYRYFQASDLPADGGSAALTPQLAARRARARKARLADAPIDVCPTCYTQLPATKICDNCS
jgi:hypothetical protein